jgi:hypothetical protein
MMVKGRKLKSFTIRKMFIIFKEPTFIEIGRREIPRTPMIKKL